MAIRRPQAAAARHAARRTTHGSTTGGIEDLLGGQPGGRHAGLDGLGARRRQRAEGSAGRDRRRRASTPSADVEVTLDEVAHGTERLVQVGGTRLEVQIPPGRRRRPAHPTLRQGRQRAGRRNVYLRCSVAPHPVFTRNGADLTASCRSPSARRCSVARCRWRRSPGKVLLRIPPETQNGRTFRLTGQGLPRFKAEGAGDLYARVRVVLPTGLDDEDRDAPARLHRPHQQPDPANGRPQPRPPPVDPTATDPAPGATRP